jgi:cholesterol oxidase
MAFPTLDRIEFNGGDGAALLLHHTSGGTRGPVIVTPGTAMTALSYCIDTTPTNLVEFLVAEGFDVWLFDWRTSPLLPAHKDAYTLDDVARYDWPAAVAEVKRRTGTKEVSVMAHCLSSPCFLLGLVRGYVQGSDIRSFVASQVALHLNFTPVGSTKLQLRVDRLLPSADMIHQKPDEVRMRVSDLAVSFLASVIPKSYSCDNRACYRHSATFGDLILHSRVSATTHSMMGDLVPECLTAFLKDVAVWGRQKTVLRPDDYDHLDRLKLPIAFFSGSENRMFIPKSSERTFKLLSARNGSQYYSRKVYDGFGHLDCFVSNDARSVIWPNIASALR